MSLKPGSHNFTYTVTSEFFSYFENSLLQSGNADVSVQLFKQDERLFTMDIHMEGGIQLVCDRCTTEFTYPVSTVGKYILKVVNSKEEAVDEDFVFYVTPDKDHINLSDTIYEMIHLNIPIRHTCEMGGVSCDEEMLERISSYELNNNNKQSDPRWDKLRNLMTN